MNYLLLVVPAGVVLWALVFVSFRFTRGPAFLDDVRPSDVDRPCPGSGHHPSTALTWSELDDQQLTRLLDGPQE